MTKPQSTYKEYHSVCPLVQIGTLPLPLSPTSVPLLLELKGGHTAGEGLGEYQFRRREKKFSILPTLRAKLSANFLSIYQDNFLFDF